jgi:MFS family permease
MPPNHGSSIHATSSWGWAGVSSTAISTILAHWFDLHRGLALSLAPTGASVGGFAVAPILLTLSQRHGLAAAVPKVVLSLLVVIVPLIWIGIRWRADRRPPLVETTVGPRAPAITGRNEVLQDAQFWSVAAPFALALDAPRRHVGGRRRDRPRARPGRSFRSGLSCALSLVKHHTS